MDPDAIRSEVDRHLSEQLLQNRHIQRIQVAMEGQKSSQTRRSLLARALRLSPSIAPEECEIVHHYCSVLKVETEVELYVYSSNEMNAGCTQPEDGRVFILVSSILLESFDHDELRFVLGHELGHHIYDHHSIPTFVGKSSEPATAVGIPSTSMATSCRGFRRSGGNSLRRAT